MNLKPYEVTIYDDKDNLVERVTINGMEEASRYLDEHKPENGCGTIKEVKNETGTGGTSLPGHPQDSIGTRKDCEYTSFHTARQYQGHPL